MAIPNGTLQKAKGGTVDTLRARRRRRGRIHLDTASVNETSPQARVRISKARGRLTPLDLINIPVALAFGLFFAWKDALVTFLFVPSAHLVFSPLVCQSFASCLVLVIAFVAAARNVPAFPQRPMRVFAIVLVALGTVAGLLVATDVGGLALSYAASLAIGCVVAALLYVWADILSNLPVTARMGTVLAGVFVSSCVGVAVGQASALLAMNIMVVVLGVLVCVALIWSSSHYMGQAAQKALVIRPASSHHFRLVLLAVVLYAFVFGTVSGTTAEQATATSTHDFMLGMSQAMIVVSAVLTAGLLAWGRPVALSTLGRILTPILALLLLLHIPLQGSGDGWLPRLTLGFWEIVQVFVLLLIIEVAREGHASLSIAFPVGWAIVALGFAVGALAGQAFGLAFGIDEVMVQTIAVSLTVLAVLASSLLAAGRYPQAPALDTTGAAAAAHMPETATAAAAIAVGSGGDAASAPEEDPVGAASGELAARYGLSERESEVFALLARGNTRASIAEKLVISENTVRVHVKNIYAKLHIHSKQQLIDMVDRRREQNRDA